MSEIIRVKENYYILATAALADDRPRVLKHGDTFAIFDHQGDVQPLGLHEQGLYHEGTRFLSQLVLRIAGKRPLFLSSTVRDNNALLTVDLTNPDIHGGEKLIAPRGVLHIFRAKFLWNGGCYERVRLANFGAATLEVHLSFEFDADFIDIFEVRGAQREQRGLRGDAQVDKDRVTIPYQGLDGVSRRAIFRFSPAPSQLGPQQCRLDARLAPKEERNFFLSISCEVGSQEALPSGEYETAFKAASRALEQIEQGECRIHSSNEQFNNWVNRSASDLRMMVTQLPTGPYPYAGVPWFSAPFGRDGILTALEALWFNPALARGALGFLAATQSKQVDPERDAEPGKILHELRKGEMAALREIPFGRYYGSVDATPLFAILAGEYFKATGDRALVEEIWPNLIAAVEWLDTFGDPDRDGFVEYSRRSAQGLLQQGWKDSQDAVFHADGRLAQGPIALCEVQGYAFAAKLHMADLASALGHSELAATWVRQADRLQQEFERAFWCEDLGTYALALDGDKKACRVKTSNAGHCLFTEISPAEHAARTAHTLCQSESFSGWGIRTVASDEIRYNPMSYHNGSIWPHDNALIACGFARAGHKELAAQVFDALFASSKFFDLNRMPELFCGFERRAGEGPTLYPVACAPQAWSAAAVFLLVQSCLGMKLCAGENRLEFREPLLPGFLRELEIQNLRVGSASVDLRFGRSENDVEIAVERRSGNLEVIVVK
ncbi:MAG TPA: amylo-alpha-1,6-glucosidase [Myxococcaceae bacterium]|nr:amylo-alpha-1,6-glucosidase [Myxococcaceae bacterium]